MVEMNGALKCAAIDNRRPSCWSVIKRRKPQSAFTSPMIKVHFHSEPILTGREK